MYLQLFMHHAHAHAALTAIHIVQMYTKHTHTDPGYSTSSKYDWSHVPNAHWKCCFVRSGRSEIIFSWIVCSHAHGTHTHGHSMQGTGHRMNYSEEDDEEGTCACAMLLLHRKGETHTRHDTHTDECILHYKFKRQIYYNSEHNFKVPEGQHKASEQLQWVPQRTRYFVRVWVWVFARARAFTQQVHSSGLCSVVTTMMTGCNNHNSFWWLHSTVSISRFSVCVSLYTRSDCKATVPRRDFRWDSQCTEK